MLISGRSFAAGLAALALLSGCAQQVIPANPSQSPSVHGSATQFVPTPQATTPTPRPSSEETQKSPTPTPSTPKPPKPKPLLERGDKGSKVRDLQARLQQVKWYKGRVDGVYGPQTVKAVRGFQSRRDLPQTGAVDQTTLDKLRSMTRKPTAEELAGVPVATGEGMRLDPRCLTGRVLCASKSQRKLAWVVDGKIKTVLDARFGRRSMPTSNGVFSVTWKSRNHWSKKYDAPMPYALFFNGGQAVHYSPDFVAEGYNGASHGCINIRDKSSMRALFGKVKVGDRVVVYPD